MPGRRRPALASTRALAASAVLALLVTTALGVLATPRPATATIGCPNCATMVIDLSGTGTGIVTDGSPGHSCAYGGAPVECMFSYQWSIIDPSISVTLTATPSADSVACAPDISATCAPYGTVLTEAYTLFNNDPPAPQNLVFTHANSGWVHVDLSGNGAGSVVEPAVSCQYTGHPISCDHEYSWDPSITTLSVSIDVQAAPGSGICGSSCALTLPAVVFTAPLVNGGSATVAIEFATLATSPPASGHPTPRPAKSPVPSVAPPSISIQQGPTAASTASPTTSPSPPSGEPVSSGSPGAAEPAASQGSSTLPVAGALILVALLALLGAAILRRRPPARP